MIASTYSRESSGQAGTDKPPSDTSAPTPRHAPEKTANGGWNIGRRSDDLIPIEQAAADLGIEPKRLRGFVLRNGLADPIGDMVHVYGWSLATLRERLRAADHASEVQP